MSSGTIIPGGNFVKSTVSREGPIVKQLHSKQTSIMDYGTPIGVTSLKPIEEVDVCNRNKNALTLLSRMYLNIVITRYMYKY